MKTVFAIYMWYGDGDGYSTHVLIGVFSSEEKAVEGCRRIAEDDEKIYLPSDNLEVGSSYYSVNKGEMINFYCSENSFFEIKEIPLDEIIRI